MCLTALPYSLFSTPTLHYFVKVRTTQAVVLIDTFSDLFYSFFIVVYLIVSAIQNQDIFNNSDKYEQVRSSSHLILLCYFFTW